MADLINIHSSSDNQQIIDQFIPFGADRLLTNYVLDLMNELGQEAMNAIQTYVPVDWRTGNELRNANIQYEDATSLAEKASVFVEGQHQGYSSVKPAPILIDILNQGQEGGVDLHRTQDSHDVGGYPSQPEGQETAGWLDDAQEAFLRNIGL